MTCKPIKERLPNLASTAKRQGSIGNVVLLVFGAWLVMPTLIDKYRGEPYITAVVQHNISELGEPELVVDTQVRHANNGSRHNFVYNENNKILCTKEWETVWDNSTNWVWGFEAFTGCDVPNEPYRVCTTFAVHGLSGMRKLFGEDQEYCTDLVIPQTTEARL